MDLCGFQADPQSCSLPHPPPHRVTLHIHGDCEFINNLSRWIEEGLEGVRLVVTTLAQCVPKAGEKT